MGYGDLYTVEHHVGLYRPEEARYAPLWASVQLGTCNQSDATCTASIDNGDGFNHRFN